MHIRAWAALPVHDLVAFSSLKWNFVEPFVPSRFSLCLYREDGAICQVSVGVSARVMHTQRYVKKILTSVLTNI